MPPGHAEPRVSLSHRDRLNDPGASSLDLDDETASARRSVSTADLNDDSDLDDDEDDSSHRISLQGPKIRFHSRPPWETDEDILEGEESDHSSRSGTIGSKFKGKASKADSLMRTFGRGTSVASRPSIESARSQTSSKPSFEMTAGNYSSSRGALYALAQESMSTGSLTGPSPPSTAPSSAVRQNFSLPRTNNYPPSGHYSNQMHASSSGAASSLLGNNTSPTHEDGHAPSSPSSDVSRHHDRSATPSSLCPSQERSSHEEFVHPYANPDLVASYTPVPITVSPHRTVFGNIIRSDSNATVTDSISTRSAAFSAMSTETSATSIPSRDVPIGNPRLNGKGISSPITVLRANDLNATNVDRNTKFLSLHPPPVGFNGAGWNNQPHSPTVTLISLQEAQARERSRSATVNTTAPLPPTKGHDAASRVPFPDSDDAASIAESQYGEVGATVNGVSARGRARSTSAGARAKNALHSMVGAPQTFKPERRDSEPAVSPVTTAPSGRPLKHKKSGFMRLFGGRGVDGDKEKSPPPPVPSLSDTYSEHNLQIQSNGQTSKLTLPRVPVPSFSPSLLGAAASSSTLNTVNGEGDELDFKVHSSRKRHPPPLYIVTGASGPTSPNSTPEPSFLARGAPASSLDLAPPPSLSINVPQSAPPGTTDFQGLKLRPISTSFSTHFADIVSSPDQETLPDIYTPSSAASSGTALSPITPTSTRRSDDMPVGTAKGSAEQSLVIKALQEQIISAKTAWQRQIWELQGQVRDLKAEVEDLRAADDKDYCELCGRGDPQKHCSPVAAETRSKKVGIVNRPRARTGDAARFASGN
ncbi:hypothetical protein HYDPIDRAFT_24847 [Hydnomerulius pinastri MD-312]|nr:hypothetical protein HYDPIDRAFT_24847 [Hydnomerulius pinastri MD-312]